MSDAKAVTPVILTPIKTESSQPVDSVIATINQTLYGPQYCAVCKLVRSILVYKLEHSDYTRMDGTKLTVGFVGTQVCSVCFNVIKAGAA